MTVDVSADRKPGRRTGALKRLSSSDAVAIREILAIAWQAMEPEERTQRQMFAALMPDIYVLRHKGYSFPQIAKLLNDSGFQLQPGTVRGYYAEMIEEKMALCQQRLDEQMLLLHEAEQLTRSAEVPKIAGRIIELREQNRKAVEHKVHSVLSIAHQGPGRDDAAAHGVPPKASSRPPTPAPDPAPPSLSESEASRTDRTEDPQNSFGLLAAGAEKVSVKPGGGFFNLDEDDGPRVPALNPKSPSPETPPADLSGEGGKALRCAPLKKDVKPLDKRPGVPPEVYEDRALEHPAIPGLMLSRDERLYGALLEIILDDGQIIVESMEQKRFRIKWTKPVAASGNTDSFVPLHQTALPAS